VAADWRDERIAELEGELARKDAELAARGIRPVSSTWRRNRIG
jgi:hypothetical protein